MSDKERFMEKVVKQADGCWIWTAAYDAAGYGRFWLGRRMQPASQASYRLFRGVPSTGMEVLHVCPNKGCVNPNHLRLGTHAENMADLAVRGNNSLKKVDAKTALELRNKGHSLAEIAAVFGASKQAVFKILERTYGKSSHGKH